MVAVNALPTSLLGTRTSRTTCDLVSLGVLETFLGELSLPQIKKQRQKKTSNLALPCYTTPPISTFPVSSYSEIALHSDFAV